MAGGFRTGTRPSFNLKFKLPFVDIEVIDIAGYAALRKGAPVAGPFMLVERASGYALETDARAQPFTRPVLGTAHGGLGQQWGFRRPVSKSDEFTILSVVNGMALDATTVDATVPAGNGAPLVLYEEHAEPWQRWEMQPVPDGIGWMITSVHNGHVIDCTPVPQPGKELVWMWERNGLAHQQFLILPIGRVPR
jgi:hypothetical protein